MSAVRNVIVIGSGPAGHTAAIYAARANLGPLMFEGLVRGGIPGGQLMIANDVENYPGFPEMIAGPDLMKAFREQALAQGVEIVTADIDRVEVCERPFRVWARDDREPREARTLIVATGSQARWLGLESEAALQGKGVSVSAVYDGSLFRGQDAVVVGGGDTALEEAMYLSRFCSSVLLVHRGSAFRARRATQTRVLGNPTIRVAYDTVVEEVLDVARGEVTGARLRNVKTDEAMVAACAGIFVAIGHTPNTDLFRGQLELDDSGYIKTAPDSTHTSVPGVFACGHARDAVYHQAVTAAASGCMAALDAERWIARHDG
jgi:thioredoxin reductase (NADPH)